MAANLAQLQAQLAALQAENASLKEQSTKRNTLTFKVSEKGALAVYGLQRFPVTLYAEQWDRLFAVIEPLKQFRVANAAQFSSKADKVSVANVEGTVVASRIG